MQALSKHKMRKKADKGSIGSWLRSVPFESKKKQEEVWIYEDGKCKKYYNVEITFGKPVDILSLKLNMIDKFYLNVAKIRNSRIGLFKKNNLQRIGFCPICGSETKQMREVLCVYGARYIYCEKCCHFFVKEIPTKKSLEVFYSNDLQYQSTYADKKTAQLRVEQVAMPKAKWMIRQFVRLYGRKPKAVLDVGAGSGHFVYACKKLGIPAAGIELSKTGRDFCKANFDLELVNADFTREWSAFKGYDVVTFWGIIEHVPYPMNMLKAASMILSGENGLIVAEVPRWHSFSTAVQSAFLDSIVRHLDPLGHINCFTDSSLATAFVKNNFDLVAAWYFGMDAYELVMQMSHLLHEPKVIQKMGKYLPAFQDRLDLSRLSDEMVFAGKPAVH